MVFFVLQFAGAQDTGSLLTASMYSVPIILQQIQFENLLQKTVGPHFPPIAIDFKT